MKDKPKYSIMIPVNNVRNYLPGTIDSIIKQNYHNYELIISDDSSTDGTAEYIDTLDNPIIKVLHTPRRMTTAEHFDWVQTHAQGTWQIFLGGDDGLQPYFFMLADKLTDIAGKKNLRAIASRRAYFFWNGCETVYGDMAISYSAEKKIYVCDSKKETLKTLYGKKDYFELAQMYMSSLFHCSLILEVRSKQKGRFLTYEVADANMAAISTLYEKQYLQCEIPLGWVGTSPKRLRTNDEFADLVTRTMPRVCGDYRIGSLSLYFWGALNSVLQFCPECATYINNEQFVKKMLPYVYLEISNDASFKESKKYTFFQQLLEINKVSFRYIRRRIFYIKCKNKLRTVFLFPRRCVRFVLRKMHLVKTVNNVWIQVTWSEFPTMTYSKANEIVMGKIINDIHNIFKTE